MPTDSVAGIARHLGAGSLLARLKSETAGLHERIERVVPLMRPELDRAGYRDYLARLLGYLGPLEARLARFAGAWADHGVDFAARRKRDLVVRDLLALGVEEVEIEALPECQALPAIESFAAAWGCLYVLEGSTLGGQIILRTVGPRLHLTRDHGLGFLAGYGEQTGSTWKAFVAAAARFDDEGGDRDAAVRGAIETFETQMAWLATSPAVGDTVE